MTESLAEFKDSFFYGSRSDLNVKFLADLSPEEAGDFFAEMLASIGHVLDDGDVEPLIGRFIEWQRRAYAGHLDRKAKFAYDDTPFHTVDPTSRREPRRPDHLQWTLRRR